MIIDNVYIDPLLKAFATFEEFRVEMKTEQEKAGTILAYGYTYELVWKTMKRLLAERGKVENSPRDVFRVAALVGFIEDPELWFEFLKMRNITVHTYQKEEAEMVLAILPDFSKEVKAFLIRIGVDEHSIGA